MYIVNKGQYYLHLTLNELYVYNVEAARKSNISAMSCKIVKYIFLS